MRAINVHPTAIGPTTFGNVALQTAFYPLGCLTAHAKAHRGGELRRSFEFQPITPMQAHEIGPYVERLPEQPAVHLMSCFVWNVSANLQLASEIKRKSPGSMIVVGGPHIPRAPDRCGAFLVEHPFVDVASRNEGEATLVAILESIASFGSDLDALTRTELSAVLGITYRRDGALVRTPDRPRERDLSRFPSPYTTGEYDAWFQGMPFMPLETNRGCPYGCTFCDWGAATLSKIHRRDMGSVFAELEFGARMQTRMIGIVDANFGILPRDVEIAEHLVQLHQTFGYPKTVAYSNAKVATPRLRDIARMFHRSGLITSAQISIQTTDERVLANVERKNIKTVEYTKLISFFHQEQIPVVSDMMVGLPGQTLGTIETDLQFLFDHKVVALPFATSVMPNAPMANDDYKKRFLIAVDSAGIVVATSTFGPEEYARMYRLCLAYKLFVKLGVARYLLYFVQLEHGIDALDFIGRWLEAAVAEPLTYPISHEVETLILAKDLTGGARDWLALSWSDETGQALFGAIDTFYEELLTLLRRQFGVDARGSDVESILRANAAVLPATGRRFPDAVPLQHDVPGYFRELRALPDVRNLPATFRKLAERPDGCIELAAQPTKESYAFADLELTYGSLELASNLFI
jgi:radical SAM superfamily enzyme YgiQ (UPF0313 family)